MELPAPEPCRLCLRVTEGSIDINSTEGMALNVGGILSVHLSFEGSNIRSTIVCISCWTIVEQFHQLYTMVKYNNQNFEVVSVDVKPIKLEDASYPLIDCNTETLSIEKLEPATVVMVETQIPVLPRSRRTEKTRKREKKVETSSHSKKSSSKSRPKAYIQSEGAICHPGSSELDKATIKQYFHMHCDLCGVSYEKLEDFREHHSQMHSQKGYLRCAICAKRFNRLKWVLEHCSFHENPNKFKCPTCGKPFEHSRALAYHQEYTHAPEEVRKHKCQQCPRMFMRKHLLTAHFKQAHTPDALKKFECYICHQKFNQRSTLMIHISRVHENGDSCVCDVCARFFKCSISYERHYRNEHTNLTEKVQCALCGNWLKHSESLREHMRRHQASSETCTLCGHVSANIKAMRAHVRSAHTAATLPCTVCGKMFKKPQTLKEHMAIHTGRTDLYSCKFCDKTFRSSANMYAHRKRAHPVEYASTYHQLRGKRFTVDNTSA